MQPSYDFFTAYGAFSVGDDPKAIASFYGESFIAAAPGGTASYHNDDKFIDWLNGIIQFNQDVGMQQMKPLTVDTTAMGEHFTLAKVTWEALFAKTGNKPITFDISYILQHTTNETKIICYVSHDDQEVVMKEHDLI